MGTGSGVLANDADPDGGSLSVVSFSASSSQGGDLSLSADGSFTYTPNTSFSGNDSFTYEVCDLGLP